jgi:hypothetical protein
MLTAVTLVVLLGLILPSTAAAPGEASRGAVTSPSDRGAQVDGGTGPSAHPTGVLWSPNPILSSVMGRQGAAVASETGSDLVLVFGGSNSSVDGLPLSSTYVVWLDNETVHQVPTPAGLQARAEASLAWDGSLGIPRFVLFGGQGSAGNVFRDTWWFFPENFTWVQVCGPVPFPSPCAVPSSWGSSFQAEPGTNLLTLFGGQSGGVPLYLKDTWTYAVGSGWTNVTSGTSPPALFEACSTVLDVGGGEMLLFGGELADGTYSNQTWELTWSSLIWTMVPPTPYWPLGREACALADTSPGPSALLCGGLNGTTVYNDAWDFDASSSTWVHLGPQVPGPLAYASMINWTARGEDSLWVYGGSNGTEQGLSEAWVGALLPLPGPTLGVPTLTPSPPVIGVPFNVSATALAPGALSVTQVNISVDYPGGGITRGALLSRYNGTPAWGNWSILLPGPTSPGTLSWTVVALDTSGATAVQGGSTTVAPVPGTLQGFVYGETVVGGRPTVGPIAGAKVYANGSTMSNTTSLVTGSSGEYTFSLPAGRYDVSAFAPTYLPQNATASVDWGTTTSLDLTLPLIQAPVGELQGFVYGLASVAGHAEVTPLVGASLVITGTGPGNVTHTTTASDGGYAVALPVGDYQVNVSVSGYASGSNRSTVQRAETTSLDFWLPSLSVQSGIDLEGNVTIAGTSPPEDLIGVLVVANTSTHGLQYTGLTNDNGTYAFSLEPGEDYNVTFSVGGYHPVYWNFSYAVGGYLIYHDVNMSADNPAFELFATLTASSGSPVSGTQVTATVTVTNGDLVAQSDGSVVLTLVGPGGSPRITETSNDTGGIAAPLNHSGDLQEIFVAPSGITTPTVYTLHAIVSALGFSNKVTTQVELIISPVPPAPLPPTSSATSWTTIAIIAILVAVVTVLASFLVSRRNPPRVEEIFLVYKGGKLVWHASRTARADLEPEVVTGMLEAIEGFVQKSFTPEGGHLHVLEFANMKLHIVRGERLTAAALIGGRRPQETVRQVQVALIDMEKAWKAALEDWDGTSTSLPHIRAYVEALLNGYYYGHNHLKTEETEGTKASA